MNVQKKIEVETQKKLQELKQANMESLSAFKSHTKDFWLNRAVLVCAYSNIVLGLAVLTGWSLGLIDIISMGKKFVPMAEESALLFIITGFTLVLIRGNSQSRVLHYLRICSSGIIGIVALLALIDFGTSYKWNLSDFIGTSDSIRLGFLTGKISPVTAISFLFISIALLLLRTNFRKYSVIFSSLVLFTAYTVVVGYSYGVPFLYIGKTIPMALLTAIAFIVASAGLLLAAGKDTAPLSYFMEDSTRARLVRSILPVIFLAMLTHDLFDAYATKGLSSSSALTNSIIDILLLLVTGFIISVISRYIGKSIDKNIGERKLAEKALRKSEQKLKDIIYCIGDWVWETDENGIYTSIENNGINKYGYQNEEIIGKTPFDFMLPEEAEKVKVIFLEIAASKLNVKDLENWNIQKNGQRICLLTNGIPILDEDGTMKGYRGVDKDITQRKKLEESLKVLSVAIENTKASVVITDVNGMIEYGNPFFSQLTGYTPEEYLGKNPSILKSGVHPAEFYREMWISILSGKTWEGEFYNCKKNGEYYWEFAIISPICDLNNSITHFVAIKTDITDSKLLQAELIRSKEKAEESDRLKSAFLSNMSHEIRTPMNGILGFAELLKEPGLTGEQQADYIRIINKSGVRMLNIINDIIDISKIESGQMKVEISKSNINEQIEYIHTFFKPEVERKGMQLYYKNALPVKEAYTYTDREKLYAILTNLVKNAIKYTDTGSIEFGYVSTSSTTGSVSELVELEFYVKDTGIGIHPDRQQAVFERFIQADTSDSRAFQGAGLGLTIAKSYIEMLGGKIRVESEYGKGSTFYFTLPFRHDSVEKILVTKESLAEVDKVLNKKLKVLVAEDDEASQQLLSKTLQDFSNEIQIVTNGRDVIEACRNQPDIDLVLMDIEMPLIDGYEATRQIRQFNPEIIIIAQTAFGLKGDRNLAIEAGCNDYISKPINRKQLHSMINKHFRN